MGYNTTTEPMERLIDSHKKAVYHFSSIITDQENDTIVSNDGNSANRYIGILMGQAIMLERALMEYGCYHGFGYVDADMNPVNIDSPDFKEWRRVYYVKK